MDNCSPFKWRHFEAEIIFAECPLVPAVSTELPRPGGDDA